MKPVLITKFRTFFNVCPEDNIVVWVYVGAYDDFELFTESSPWGAVDSTMVKVSCTRCLILNDVKIHLDCAPIGLEKPYSRASVPSDRYKRPWTSDMHHDSYEMTSNYSGCVLWLLQKDYVLQLPTALWSSEKTVNRKGQLLHIFCPNWHWSTVKKFFNLRQE